MKPARVLLFAPMPPPLHGQALMAGVLAEQSNTWREVELYSIDAKFSDSLADLKSFSLGKVLRLIRYAWRITWTCLTKRIRFVILTPGFYRNTFLKDAVFIWLTSFFLRRNVIAWFHMDYAPFDDGAQPGWFRSFLKRTLRRCSRFVVCTERLKATAPAFLDADTITALQNGIPDPAADGAARPGSHPILTVLYVSNMMEAKGWKVLLDAASHLCRKRPDVCFHFFGAPTGEMSEGEIRSAFAASPNPERICYRGFLDAAGKAAAFRGADLFCMPTFTEAFPVAVTEALAFGLPIVASRVGGIPDLVDEGGNAWLVEPRNAGALAATLSEALADRERLAAFGKSARRRYEEHFTSKAFGDRWEHWLSSVAASAA